jgi:hypothetical protein
MEDAKTLMGKWNAAREAVKMHEQEMPASVRSKKRKQNQLKNVESALERRDSTSSDSTHGTEASQGGCGDRVKLRRSCQLLGPIGFMAFGRCLHASAQLCRFHYAHRSTRIFCTGHAGRFEAWAHEHTVDSWSAPRKLFTIGGDGDRTAYERACFGWGDSTILVASTALTDGQPYTQVRLFSIQGEFLCEFGSMDGDFGAAAVTAMCPLSRQTVATLSFSIPSPFYSSPCADASS